MAAGKGVRMRTSRPKVLHQVAGVPMVGHVVSAASRVEPASTVLVVSPDAHDTIAGELGDDVQYAEQPDPLGTGHALAIALERVPFNIRHILLLNGDMPLITGDDVAGLAELHLKRRASITVLSAPVPAADAKDLGRLERGARGKPLAIVEAEEAKAVPSVTVEVGVGAYALDAAWIRVAVADLRKHASGEYYVTDLVAMAVAEGHRVESFATSTVIEAIGVNTRGQLARAERAMQRRLRDAAMEGGATLIDPDTVYLDVTVKVAEDVTIHPNTTLRGTTRVAAGVSIGPNAQVSDTSIGPDAVVGAAVIDSAVIDERVRVGAFSLVRPGSHLCRDVFVGNHVEIKNSTVGPETHIGHFSYVGDSEIGSGVNIGAGAVTCNFDGVSKHVTRIGDGAFIGSGCMLVAPVNIGAHAVTGAGAVVTHDVGPGEQVAGVPARNMQSRRRLSVAAGDEGGTSLG